MKSAGHRALLSGLNVLVVEDQYLIAEDMRRAVVALGGAVIGPAAELSTAAKLASESSPDLALLDINLHGETVLPVAQRLRELNVPVIFATGYGPPDLPPGAPRSAHLEKPVTVAALAAALQELGVGQ